MLIQGAVTEIWPGENVEEVQIRSALKAAEHAGAVAAVGEQVAGFVDGFITTSAGGEVRWEIDLLGVLPAIRGMGIGSRLVAFNLEQAMEFQPDFARALVKNDNYPSQQVFRGLGFEESDLQYVLYTSSIPASPKAGVPMEAAFIPVLTFRYSGIWVEGCLSEAAFRAARTLLGQGCAVAGALIDQRDEDSVEAAEAAGFSPGPLYCWWKKVFNN